MTEILLFLIVVVLIGVAAEIEKVGKVLQKIADAKERELDHMRRWPQ